MKLTVYHDGQFWVGVFEQVMDSKLKASRFIFGAEPQDEEIFHLVNTQMLSILRRTSQTIEVEETIERQLNPKRLARNVALETKSFGISTKAQKAIQLQREQAKKEKKTFSRERNEELAERKWQQKRLKAKEKHRGR